jgi:hypothetical protein
MYRELSPRGMHVGHVVVDVAVVDNPMLKGTARYEQMQRDGLLMGLDSVASAFWALHCQPSDAWSWELDIRPAQGEYVRSNHCG